MAERTRRFELTRIVVNEDGERKGILLEDNATRVLSAIDQDGNYISPNGNPSELEVLIYSSRNEGVTHRWIFEQFRDILKCAQVYLERSTVEPLPSEKSTAYSG